MPPAYIVPLPIASHSVLIQEVFTWDLDLMPLVCGRRTDMNGIGKALKFC